MYVLQWENHMFYSAALPPTDIVAPFDFYAQGTDIVPECLAREPSRPALIPSIAKTAGLGRFVYLVGQTGKRYVFSAINIKQVSLYCGAIFAVSHAEQDDILWVGSFTRLTRLFCQNVFPGDSRIFVHLLAEGTCATSDIIADLFHDPDDHFNSLGT